MFFVVPLALLAGIGHAADAPVLTGTRAFAGWRGDAPGVTRRIVVADLPPPFATVSVTNHAKIVPQPAGAFPQVPAGFRVELLAGGLDEPRLVRVAPNGDIFIAESVVGRIRVFRLGANGKVQANEIFASGLNLPFGIAFWPPGPQPTYVYVANTDSVVRFPYQAGDLRARGAAQTVVGHIPGGGFLTGGGHWTRDVAFSKDGSRMFVSVGSATNDAETMGRYSHAELTKWVRHHALGAAWGPEKLRANVLEFKPDGSGLRVFATGLRNCVGLAIDPPTGAVWCSTNERDTLGDNLPPDYVTMVHEGGFYGWPWFYIGDHEDPYHRGQRPDLKDKVIVPDVLLEAHSASLQMVFYEGRQFPAQYVGDAFAAEHGSWNRANRTGSKVIRIPMRDGHATGEYQDFMTGFITPQGDTWGRPVGVAVAADGSLIVTEDANGAVWRISYTGARPANP